VTDSITVNSDERLTMRKVSLLVAGVTVLGCLTAGASSVNANEAGILSCYDHAASYSKPAAQDFVPGGFPSGFWAKTTSYCGDINIRPHQSRQVRVCFLPSSGAPAYCQANFRHAEGNAWTVIASNVADGTRFKINFASDPSSVGQYAA
jgi:hypothetical protein